MYPTKMLYTAWARLAPKLEWLDTAKDQIRWLDNYATLLTHQSYHVAEA